MARPVPNSILGIDVAHWQGVIDWMAVATTESEWGTVRFVYAKATTGATGKDQQWLVNAAGAEKAGLPVGAYHWLRPGYNTPVGEAKNFVAAIKKARAGGAQVALAPMIDLEEKPSSTLSGDPQDVIDYVTEFAAYVKDQLGQRCILYVGSNYAAQYLGRRKIHGLPVWIPAYNTPSCKYSATTAGPKKLNVATQDWAVWQFCSKGSIPGIKTSVDLNTLRGDAKSAIGLDGSDAGGTGVLSTGGVVLKVSVVVTLLILAMAYFIFFR